MQSEIQTPTAAFDEMRSRKRSQKALWTSAGSTSEGGDQDLQARPLLHTSRVSSPFPGNNSSKKEPLSALMKVTGLTELHGLTSCERLGLLPPLAPEKGSAPVSAASRTFRTFLLMSRFPNAPVSLSLPKSETSSHGLWKPLRGEDGSGMETPEASASSWPPGTCPSTCCTEGGTSTSFRPCL